MVLFMQKSMVHHSRDLTPVLFIKVLVEEISPKITKDIDTNIWK